MRKYMTATIALAAMAIGMPAFAGFGDLKNLGRDAASVTQESSEVSQETIVQNFAGALATVMQGQAELNEAFGFKEKAAELRSTADALTGGSTVSKDDLEKARAISDEARASSQEKIDAGEELSAGGREHYANGLVLTAHGTSQTKAMAQEASDFATSAKEQISSASMLQKAKVTKKLAAGMFVAKELPGFTSELVQNFGMLVSYAKSAEIPVPDDATDLLAAL